MSGINQTTFHHNLRITQAYCELRLQQKLKSVAEMFRSFNPMMNVTNATPKKNMFTTFLSRFNSKKDFQPLFTFMQPPLFPERKYDSYSSMSRWTIEPLDNKFLHKLFNKQLHFKKNVRSRRSSESYKGAILICHIDQTPVDGASEAESLGFIDKYDLPPIDTWFYLTKQKDENILFAWIPQNFMQLTNDGILVNCVECFTWFEDTYPEAYEALDLLIA